MTRNDCEILAGHLSAMNPGTIDDAGDTHTAGYIEGYNAAINQICGACSATNARFNTKVFKNACAKETSK